MRWLLGLMTAAICGCAPAPKSRNEMLAAFILAEVRTRDSKEESPYLVTLTSAGVPLEIEARKRILAQSDRSGFRLVDSLIVDPKNELKWTADVRGRYRGRISIEIVSWISDDEVIVSNHRDFGPLSGSGARIRLKKHAGQWTLAETLERWDS